jgi:hypothetical protein
MRVDLLHHPECPSAPAVHRLVQDCLAVLPTPTTLHVRVGASPTVLIDGFRAAAELNESAPAGRANRCQGWDRQTSWRDGGQA